MRVRRHQNGLCAESGTEQRSAPGIWADYGSIPYGTIVMDSEQPQGVGTSAGGMAQGIQAAPDSRKTVFRP